MKSISCSIESDISMIAEIHVACWREVYCFMPNTVHSDRDYEYRLAQWTQWLSRRSKKEALFTIKSGSKIVGFAAVKPNIDQCVPVPGELHACYLLPEYRGTCLGPLAMRTMADFLFETQQWPACIWAFKNSPFRRIYPQLGASTEVIRNRIIAGVPLPEIGYRVESYSLFKSRLDRMYASADQRRIESPQRRPRLLSLHG